MAALIAETKGWFTIYRARYVATGSHTSFNGLVAATNARVEIISIPAFVAATSH